ncbi:MAG: L,D-transpeptidase family protein [Candidatus Omnitrophica bacterium]|nr:L,D-transpeptidase family protein [Candidatus Omnitrophota bacterium]
MGKIAKRFGTTVELIIKANNLKSDLIKPGMKLKISTAKFSILVDKSQNTLTLKSNDEVFKIYPVSTGVDNSTPIGQFKIINKIIDPVWYKAGAVVLPGSPKNILGSRWLGLSLQGYGIHGTTEPESIGKQVTAGCVRMLNKDVEELYIIVPIGADVTIVD